MVATFITAIPIRIISIRSLSIPVLKSIVPMIFSKITKTLIAMQIIAEFTAFPPFLAPPSAGAFFTHFSLGRSESAQSSL
jgi:hypothetical protein